MKLALQIYTLRDKFDADGIAAVLAKAKAMGYDGVEWFDLMGVTPAELAEMTRSAGLEFFSMHINWAALSACDTALMDELAAAGAKYLPIGWLPEERLAGGPLFEETCRQIEVYSKEAAKRGLKVLYHNHDFDLAKYGGATKLDALYEALPAELLAAELDTCWLYTGGVDAAGYLKKYADRAPIIHLKDCVKEGGRSGYKPIGTGVLNWDELLPLCGQADWVCVEQDEPSDGLDSYCCAGMSAAYLKGKGI